MLDKLKYLSKHSFFKYLFIAAIIVLIELGVFQFLNVFLSINYLIATVLSMLVGIVLNWIASRLFVFEPSHHTKKAEFGLVLAASLVGVGIQSLTSFISVGIFNFSPLVGKMLAICITFFWNYFIRALFIYKKRGV